MVTNKNTIMTDNTLYGFNPSQDVINLQTKYTLFKRVANIVFSTTVDKGFDKNLMRQALDKLVERNDCLRITFVRKDKKIMQYFAPERRLDNIKSVTFSRQSEMTSFINKFRKRELNMFKGETLKAVFATNPDGKDMVIFKISHYVADTYAIGVLVSDLFQIYDALKAGTAMPPLPGSFEEVLKKDLAYKDNAETVARDLAFFKDYYVTRHPEHPTYCGIHGNNSDRWLKYKDKGYFALPYLFVKCDTKGYKLTIPSAVTEKAEKWCQENNITMSALFFYTCSIAASLINNREKYQAPLMLLDCRGTVAERKAGGTKVQSLSVYTTVNYDKSFIENIQEAYADQNQLFRHTRLTYLELENMQHKLWNYSIMSQVINFCYSFIPFTSPEGVSVQVHSNGKGALVTYMALMLDTKTGQIDTVYDIQTEMVTPEQLMDFHNLYIRVTEAVLAQPDTKLSQLF